MRTARRIGAAVIAALALTAAVIFTSAAPAGADTQIGWVLDAWGSVQCVVKSGTNNHVVCYHYPPGGGAASVVVDDWVPYGCLGGAYMVAGGNDGSTPAQLIYRNAPGWYCGRTYAGATAFTVAYCAGIYYADEGTFSNYYGQIQAGNYAPYNAAGQYFTMNCGTVGASQVGHYIYYV